MSMAKVAGAIAGGFVVLNMLAANTAGYLATKQIISQGYSIEQSENHFWQEYRRANSFEKAMALMMRPGIRLAYMTE